MPRATVLFSIILSVFFLSTLLTVRLLPILRKKKMGQMILEIGPSWHKSKEGTPTMGGLAPLIAIVLLGALFLLLPNFFAEKQRVGVILTLLYALLNGMVGMIDDFVKLHHHRNEGLTPPQKLILQTAFASAYLAMLFMSGVTEAHLPIPFFNITLSLGVWFYVLAVPFLVGTVNCVNLTDGIDGLATSVTMVVGGFYTYLAYTMLENGLLILGGAMMAASLSFLLFNYHPARIFMGDTGSLFFGALAAGCALISGNPLLLLFCGAVYYLEGASVILQVLWFKISGGKRLLRMAPFHHHLEKGGWSEEKIVFTMTLVSLLGAILSAFGA